MKFNYKLRRLCGAYYGYASNVESSIANNWNGTNLLYDSTGTLLISAISNRIQIIDLRLQTVRTLGVEARSSISCIALSPDDTLLVVVDVKNYAMLININRGIVLHRLNLHQRVRDIQFSPGSGQYLAITHGKNVQIWCTPSLRQREFAPLVLHRTYTGLSDDVTCLAWSPDGTVIAAGSRDCTIRIWTVNTVKGFEPITLTGHRRAIVGLYFGQNEDKESIQCLYTVSQDGTLINWKCDSNNTANTTELDANGGTVDLLSNQLQNDSIDFFTSANGLKRRKVSQRATTDAAHYLMHCTWDGTTRHYFNQSPAEVTATSYCGAGNLVVVGFSSGLFGLYELPGMANIHTLSVGTNQLIKGCVLNKTGEWLALGCPPSQQLLVWEWQSETYVLKQRGHAYGMSCMAYSPDGVVICTGGEDGKVKLWNASSGFCYVTLEKSHTAPITGVAFANSSVVLSASLDGTVRAHDLHRYRTFKTLTTPTPVQFLSLAIDEAGEIVCAGTADPFHIYAWNLQTSKILDVFTGHTGPVCGLQFLSQGGMLVSASWDGTIKTWDLYKSNVPTESLQHTSDVVCVACRPDGKQLCSGSIGGLLSFWNVEESKLLYEIDGRHDIVGGRKMNDRMAASNNAASRYFTSISYSADGTLLLAGGNSKYVCIYEVSQQILLKKIQITFNRSLDGVLDELNSKNLVDGNPIDDHGDSGDETTYNAITLPGAKRGDDGSRKSKTEVLTRQLGFSSTGREWAAVSGEGLHVYSLDDEMMFDPIQLTETVTPVAVQSKLKSGQYSIALRMAVHLNEVSLIQEVIDQTPFDKIQVVVKSIDPHHIERLMQVVSNRLVDSPHIEFFLQWCLQLLEVHGLYMERHRSLFMRCFRSMYKSILTKKDELKSISDSNKYMLEFLEFQANYQSVSS